MNPPLRFGTDRTFRIVQATDLHWRKGNCRDRKMLRVLSGALDAERPDLVVITGDTLDSSKCAEPARGWRSVSVPMVRRRIPWAAVFGNHDDEGPMGRAEQMTVQQSLPHCLSQPGPTELPGVSNYVLPILDSEGQRPAALLVLLDVPDADPGVEGYGWVRPEQIAWYRETARAYREANGGEPLPSLVFLHIPLPEYNDVWATGTCRGQQYEMVCCPPINSGLFDAMVETGGVLGVFVGHDHVNDFDGELRGIRLCYGRTGGFNTYGRWRFKKGVRVIQLRQGAGDLGSWLWLDGGTRQGDDPSAP